MRESKATVDRWLSEQAAKGFDFMFVVCDTYDYEQYPVGVKAYEFWDKYDHYNGQNMQRIEGFFDLSTRLTLINFPPKPKPETETFTVKLLKARTGEPGRFTLRKDEHGRLVEIESPERQALEEVRKTLLDPENEHVASRANKALNIIDKALGSK